MRQMKSMSISQINKTNKKNKSSSVGTFIDPNARIKPSELLKMSAVDVVAEDYPMIVEFVNIQDHTTQIHSSVDVDQPLFQPFPVVLIFEDYAPFAIHERKLFFRNNDKVMDFDFDLELLLHIHALN